MDGALKPTELQALEDIVAGAGTAIGVTRYAGASGPGMEPLPVYAITLGTADPQAPAAGFFAGVHGLERIGAQVVLSFLSTPVTIPSYFLAMLPYVATIVAVAGLVGRVRAPAADGEPYVKG